MTAHPEPAVKDRKTINEKNTVENKIICIIDRQPIADKTEVEYHNILPIASDEKIDISNFATVCKKHHKELGQLSIKEYKALIEMENFFKDSGLKKLNDVLKFKLTGQDTRTPVGFAIKDDGNEIKIDGAISLPLSTCPSTGFKYFYAVLPVEYINNDEELQPRPLELRRLWDLYRHLLVNSQLTPSVCRLADNKIFLFDGQHKAAAQIWAGRKEIECKVYINPGLKVLKETNLVAHDKLRQMQFFTSVLINKWASIFTEEWKEYMDLKGAKSESGFVTFLAHKGKKKSEALTMIESNIYDSILEDNENSIVRYINEYETNSKKPLTVTRLKQTLFKKFITTPPLDIDIEESDHLREFERKNIINILNLITDYTLKDSWNPEKNDGAHRSSERIYLNGSFKAWAAILRDVVATILELFDENERKEIFLRQISSQQWESIENCIASLFAHRIWSDESQENYNSLRLSNENLVRKYLVKRGLNVSRVLENYEEQDNNFID
jgi:hypothetical protein